MAQTDESSLPNAEGTPKTLGEQFLGLVSVVEQLRSENGCPWDRRQTPQSLLPYLLEETYEVMESITADDAAALQEELGDLLLHIVFQGCLAKESGRFTLGDSLNTVTDKLTRRHPHVFGDQRVEDTAAVRRRWETAKQREKGRTSLLDGVPRTLPALNRARRMQEKAAAVGFDWPRVAGVWAKVMEEIEELKTACAAEDAAAMQEEFGDVLFSLVNLGRFLKLSGEDALRQAINKFEQRFRGIEQELARRGRNIEEATLEEMDGIWNRLRREGKHV
jgi:tetrapyrrole methylase family protein/MazG family protein